MPTPTIPRPASPTGLGGKRRPANVGWQMGQVLASDSPTMRQAATYGRQQAQGRGLLNSTMGVQAAQGEMVRAALPIAQQQAGQAFERRQQDTRIGAEDRARAETIATDERGRAAQLAAAYDQSYSQLYASQLANPNLSKKARRDVLEHISKIRDSNMKLVNQFYPQIPLTWT
jgi:hypothetical protein